MATSRWGTVAFYSLMCASAAGGQAPGPHRVNEFMSFDASAKLVLLRITAALGTAQGGYNFNGGFQGNQIITVPLGWTVRLDFVNRDVVPHSIVVVRDAHPVPNAPDAADIGGAATSRIGAGVEAGGREDVVFRAAPAGIYLLTCGVPGHGPGGMYVHFVVPREAQVPSYR